MFENLTIAFVLVVVLVLVLVVIEIRAKIGDEDENDDDDSWPLSFQTGSEIRPSGRGLELEADLQVGYSSAMKIKAIVHEAEEGGYWAEVPALPGCVTQGETLKEVTANLHEAIAGWLSVETPATELGQSDRVIELAL